MAEDATPSLLDLARSKMQAKGPKCSVTPLIEEHPEVNDLLAATGHGKPIHYSTAAEVINEKFAQTYDGQTLSRHINGKCGCPR